ncbi:MAG TPA: GTP 3',8-cyclase MoaA [Candidatus Polarisedimenticolaceae bacterium]|nr:GTP 3',8-cyclase MoaA [Candidatus Polarisedimenticolaceae bacterium]
MLEDGFGRVHDDLRISVTDRCNLRCAYCMPVDPVWFPRSELLSFEEILRLARILAARGVRKVRLTGGEPLVRRDLPELVAMLADEPRIEDLSLTTNGLLLERAAAELARAGLSRVNVSLDTLLPHRFHAMTRRDGLAKVLAGIDAASRAGLGPIKVNTVVLRGHNEDEVEGLVERARAQAWELRFIEFMPLDNDHGWRVDRVVTGAELVERIGARWPLDPDPQADPHAPARRFLFRDGGGAIGFIDSVSRPFCADCSRLRLTSDGYFRVCLYDRDEVDLKTPLRGGADDGELERLMVRALARKGRGGALDILESRRVLPLRRTMHQIGG